MEASSNYRYSARIAVHDSQIAFLDTGDIPSHDTKQRLYPGQTYYPNSLTAIKQFKAIGIDKPAPIVITYHRSKKKMLP